jgi:hypothetical protein
MNRFPDSTTPFLGMHSWSETLTDEDVRDLIAQIMPCNA